MGAIPGTHADILESKGFAHVATIGPDGEPQSNPVWFDWDGDVLKVSQTKTRQKYRNLQREPRIALSILDPDDPYRYLEIRGSVASIEDDADFAFINSLAKKYMGEDQYPYHQPGDERVIISVKAEHATTMG